MNGDSRYGQVMEERNIKGRIKGRLKRSRDREGYNEGGKTVPLFLLFVWVDYEGGEPGGCMARGEDVLEFHLL